MRFIFLIIGISLIINCTNKIENYSVRMQNGIKITDNKNQPINLNKKIDITKTLELNLNSKIDDTKFIKNIYWVDLDKEGNIYVLDNISCQIHKYDSLGNYLTVFGRKGQGPGEFTLPGAFNIIGDTIFLSNWHANKIVKFNLSGNYLGDKKINSTSTFPSFPIKLGSLFVNNSEQMNIIDDKMIIDHNISLYDDKFNFVKKIYQQTYEIKVTSKFNPYIGTTITACSKNEIYSVISNPNKYSIDVYNKKGDRIRQINKKYRKQKLSSEEIKRENTIGKEMGLNYDIKYKIAINNLFVDKYSRLWVSSDLNNKYFDIFKNDIYQKRV